ncbi:RDD family protein [Streptomyces sp. NPDC002766]|uniref:RDD family protein n=1 Tax=unclassified Streptomyces TaxID=2593676 RepID=UPI00332FB8B2
MSAPSPAPGDDRPREGYYPDPSIPGYVRYWNGAAWVPGTSRPAPSDGESLDPPPGSDPAPAQAQAPPVPLVEETGPHFFDEDPEPAQTAPVEPPQGGGPEPASAWGADRSRQSGFGGDQDRRVSWGADPRVASDGPDRTTSTDGSATIPPARTDAAEGDSGGTFVFRRVTADSGPRGGAGGSSGAPGIPGPGGPAADEGTMTFRAVSQRTGQQGGAQGGGTGAPAGAGGGARPAPVAGASGGPGGSGSGAQPPSPGAAGASGGPAFGPQASAAAPDAPGFGAGMAAAERAAQAQAAGAQGAAPAALSQQPSVSVPPQPGDPQPAATPMAAGPGGGQASWAQQVHRLAGAEEEQRVAPWKPPVADIFQQAAMNAAAARPAGLGKRFAARLLDTVVVAGLTAVAAVPLGTKAVDHINGKIDEAKLSGRTVTVWLLDGTTSVYFGIILAVLLVVGVLYEALPTAKWGRTLGKKLLGLEVRDIEAHQPPSFGGALRRWLVYCVSGLLGIGVVGVAWCLFDRPWRQCWHDKAARTFVAG